MKPIFNICRKDNCQINKKRITALYGNNVVTLFYQFPDSYLLASTILAILTLTSYSKYNGIVTKTRVIKSGGVIIAATSIMTIKACFLYFAKSREEMNSNLAKKNIITGNWNTIPIMNVRVVNVSMYESNVIVLRIFSETLYVPKKRNEIGNNI